MTRERTREESVHAMLQMAQNDLRLSLTPDDKTLDGRPLSPSECHHFAESALDKMETAMRLLGMEPLERWGT